MSDTVWLALIAALSTVALALIANLFATIGLWIKTSHAQQSAEKSAKASTAAAVLGKANATSIGAMQNTMVEAKEALDAQTTEIKAAIKNGDK